METSLYLIAQNPLLLIVGTIIFESILVVALPPKKSKVLVDFLERMLRLFPFTAIIRELKNPPKLK